MILCTLSRRGTCTISARTAPQSSSTSGRRALPLAAAHPSCPVASALAGARVSIVRVSVPRRTSPVVLTEIALAPRGAFPVAMYTRAAASDYDDWKTVYGNKGWSSADLLPLLRKVCSISQSRPCTCSARLVSFSSFSDAHTRPIPFSARRTRFSRVNRRTGILDP